MSAMGGKQTFTRPADKTVRCGSFTSATTATSRFSSLVQLRRRQRESPEWIGSMARSFGPSMNGTSRFTSSRENAREYWFGKLKDPPRTTGMRGPIVAQHG